MNLHTILLTAAALAAAPVLAAPRAPVLLNVSYDPTREFYQEFNASFSRLWQARAGVAPELRQSHGGSGKQARAVIDGLQADVVTLALAYDIDAIAAQAHLLPTNWQSRLPHNSAPYVSTLAFLVRKGNPKGIRDWKDLVREGVSVITPNPKTSGGARWNYLAAWGYVLKTELGDLARLHDPDAADAVADAHSKAKEFIHEIYQHVEVLDTGARGSTMTFVQRGIGDVLLAWENEAFLSIHELGPDKFEIVVPSISILAEPSVALIDKVADKHGTREIAEEYLKHLYSTEGQTLAAKHYYRPRNPQGFPEKYMKRFTDVKLFTIDDVFGGWEKAQAEHFDDGGVFDQIYKP